MSVVSVVCCHLEVSPTGRSLVQGRPTGCACLIVCELESSKPRSPRPDFGYSATGGKKTHARTSQEWCFSSRICRLSATVYLWNGIKLSVYIRLFCELT
jgi:hypothetical protein